MADVEDKRKRNNNKFYLNSLLHPFFPYREEKKKKHQTDELLTEEQFKFKMK